MCLEVIRENIVTRFNENYCEKYNASYFLCCLKKLYNFSQLEFVVDIIYK